MNMRAHSAPCPIAPIVTHATAHGAPNVPSAKIMFTRGDACSLKDWFDEPATQARLSGFTDAFMCDLAGNSFVAFQFLAVVIAVLTHWPATALKPSQHNTDH